MSPLPSLFRKWRNRSTSRGEICFGSRGLRFPFEKSSRITSGVCAVLISSCCIPPVNIRPGLALSRPDKLLLPFFSSLCVCVCEASSHQLRTLVKICSIVDPNTPRCLDFRSPHTLYFLGGLVREAVFVASTRAAQLWSSCFPASRGTDKRPVDSEEFAQTHLFFKMQRFHCGENIYCVHTQSSSATNHRDHVSIRLAHSRCVCTPIAGS